MKKKTPDICLPGDDEDFEFADYGVDDEAILRHIMKLLRPRLATDPLAPAVCNYLSLEASELGMDKLSVQFPRMVVQACMAQFTPSDHRTISARVHLADCQRLERRNK